MLFIDSGNIKEIKKYVDLGVIQGITTNPTILKKDGVKNVKTFIKDVRKFFLGHISVEVTKNDEWGMVTEATELSSLSQNISVKVPIHGPEGELFYLSVLKTLCSRKISVNMTAMMSAQQCLIAARGGAEYISLFGGRVNNMGYNCIDEIKKTRALLDRFALPSKLIMGSVRETLNIVEWLIAGAYIITVPPKLIDSMIIHPYTKDTVKMFLGDV
jgi:transaldolase